MKTLKTLTLSILAFAFTALNTFAQQDFWIQKPDYSNYEGIGFSVGSKGYIVVGNSVWAFDTLSNLWSPRATFPGIVRNGGVAFSIGSKGYYGTGYYHDIHSGDQWLNDFWEYDPASDIWTQKGNFGGTERSNAVGFSIGSKGYLGLGGKQWSLEDFWEYDPATDSWTQKADFAPGRRWCATGFSIGAKGYIGTGFDWGNNFMKDFWEYDPASNTWTQKADFGGAERMYAGSFSIGSKGYIGMGIYFGGSAYLDFWEWNQQTNIWKRKADFTGPGASSPASFSIGSKGYIGIGSFYEYNPCLPPSVIHQPLSQTACAGSSVSFSVSVILDGSLSYQWAKNGNIINGATATTYTINPVSVNDAGSYTCLIRYDSCSCSYITTDAAVLTVSPSVSVSISANHSGAICSGTSVLFTATAVNGGTSPVYQWKINGNNVGTNSPTFSSSALANGDSTYCILTSNASCSLTGNPDTSNSIGFSVLPSPVATAGSDVAICKGSGTTLNASGGGTYSWSPAAGLSNTNTNNPFANPQSTTTYIVTVTGGNNCSATDNIIVTVNPQPNAGPDQGICSGGSVTLTASGGVSYAWSNGVNQGVAFSPSTTTTYIVTVTDGGGCSATDDVVVTVGTASSSFGLISPANGVHASVTPTFMWNTATGATFYNLYVDGILKRSQVTDTTYTLQGNEALTQGMHTWYVKANGCTQSNATWSILVDANPPAAFNLISPSNNGWITNQTAFLWSASSDAYSGLSKYQLWVDSTKLIDSIPASLTHIIPATLSDGPHTWFIAAVDEVGNARKSNQTWIVNSDNVPPSVDINVLCTLIYPADSQYLQSVTPAFLWSSSADTGSGFKKFQLFIDNLLVKDNLQDTSWTITSPLPYGMHTWLVKGFDSIGNNLSTYEHIFYVDNVKPEAFDLTSPTDSAVVSLPTPNLSWQPVADSAGGSGMYKYQLWINGMVNRDSIPISQTTVAPASALSQGAYAWFIRAYDNVGNVRQSNHTWTCFVDWEPPTNFSLVAPADNQTVSVFRPKFIWNPSSDIGSGINRYELNIAGYAPIVVNPPTDTSYKILFDLPNGSYTWFVNAFDLGGNSTSSNTFTVTVDAPPPVKPATPSGPTSICYNSQNSTYTVSQAGSATSYIWSLTPSGAGTITGNDTVGTVDWNNTYSGMAHITVKGHNILGDSPASDTLTVTVHTAEPAPIVTSPLTYCQYEIVPPLTANGTGLLWYTVPAGGTGTATAPTPGTTNAGTVTYYVSQTVSGCEGLRASIQVIVDPLPTTPTIALIGNDLISSAVVGNQWYCDTGLIIGDTLQICTPGFNSHYYSIVTDSTGCSSDTSNVIYVQLFGISAVDGEGLNIYPDPASDMITIEYTGFSSDSKSTFTLYSIDGQLLRSELIKQEKTQVDISSFPSGVYIIKISGNKGIIVRKLIKE